MGLSPPVRGNPTEDTKKEFAARSIPARAGEPLGNRARRLKRQVYPRPCGGTNTLLEAMNAENGLSPPVRGNPAAKGLQVHVEGSIPARAGEPGRGSGGDVRGGVYPRPCGGTPPDPEIGMRTEGLSPPVRGNRRGHGHTITLIGSIPARAGEPSRLPPRSAAMWVYPRPCGGTPWTREPMALA